MSAGGTFSCRRTASFSPPFSPFRNCDSQARASLRLGVCCGECDSNRSGAGDARRPDACHGTRRQYGHHGFVLYSLLPILRNTHTGIINIEHAYLESGKAMGMTKYQILRMVELPLALSVIMAGLRTALVIAIGITAIGTFVGAGSAI